MNTHILGSEEEMVMLNTDLWEAGILKNTPRIQRKISASSKAQAVDLRLCQGKVFISKD